MTRRERSSSKREKRRGLGSCGYCGKQTYESRADARRVARTAHHGDSGLTAYECPDAKVVGILGFWHIGHLNAMVKHGDYHRYSMPTAGSKETR